MTRSTDLEILKTFCDLTFQPPRQEQGKGDLVLSIGVHNEQAMMDAAEEAGFLGPVFFYSEGLPSWPVLAEAKDLRALTLVCQRAQWRAYKQYGQRPSLVVLGDLCLPFLVVASHWFSVRGYAVAIPHIGQTHVICKNLHLLAFSESALSQVPSELNHASA